MPEQQVSQVKAKDAHKKGLSRTATGKALANFPAFRDTPFATWVKRFEALAEKSGDKKSIGNEEFLDFMAYSVGMSRAEANIFWSMFDVNDDGEVDASEFVTTMSCVAQGSLEEKLGHFFSLYDKDQNGYINGSELYVAMMAAKGLSEHDYDEEVSASFSDLLSTLDKSGDGRISQPEFMAAIMDDVRLVACLGSWLQSRPDIKEHHLYMVRNLFSKLDKDGSGHLEKKEIVNFCRQNKDVDTKEIAACEDPELKAKMQKKNEIAMAMADKMYAKMDADGNNKVTEDEFVAFMAAFYDGKSDEFIDEDLAKISAHKF